MIGGHEKSSVSVVLPVRNGSRFLAQALDAVLSQSRPPDEILIVDGHSTDDTPAIIDSFVQRDPRVRFLIQPGKGYADALNFGIGQTTGEYIALASHDDNWTPDKLEIQLAYMDAHPDVDYSIGRARFFLEPGCTIPPGFRVYLFEGEPMIFTLEALVVRRTLFERIRVFKTDYISAADVEWYARATHSGAKLGEIDHLLVHRRIHDRNTSYYNLENTREMLRALRTAIHVNKGTP